ncbi:hypothetical protein AKG34_21450 [Peribacillus butanolivorans]|uniref:hypothetical protein n=1 Tax=Peribacillus butanolivorans TaxID=421767 RepID=UPI0006A6B999|nr:hypothetical protein [Peribacillus butanolivorans]KON67387.1 hypothetical protein AKG34_21450 [Peribacillus butanolivorans]
MYTNENSNLDFTPDENQERKNQKHENNDELYKTKEDLEIEKFQKKIQELKKAKKERISREKKKIRKDRDQRLIKVGYTVEKILGVEGEDKVRSAIVALLQSADDLEKILKQHRGN